VRIPPPPFPLKSVNQIFFFKKIKISDSNYRKMDFDDQDKYYRIYLESLGSEKTVSYYTNLNVYDEKLKNRDMDSIIIENVEMISNLIKDSLLKEEELFSIHSPVGNLNGKVNDCELYSLYSEVIDKKTPKSRKKEIFKFLGYGLAELKRKTENIPKMVKEIEDTKELEYYTMYTLLNSSEISSDTKTDIKNLMGGNYKDVEIESIINNMTEETKDLAKALSEKMKKKINLKIQENKNKKKLNLGKNYYKELLEEAKKTGDLGKISLLSDITHRIKNFKSRDHLGKRVAFRLGGAKLTGVVENITFSGYTVLQDGTERRVVVKNIQVLGENQTSGKPNILDLASQVIISLGKTLGHAIVIPPNYYFQYTTYLNYISNVKKFFKGSITNTFKVVVVAILTTIPKFESYGEKAIDKGFIKGRGGIDAKTFLNGVSTLLKGYNIVPIKVQNGKDDIKRPQKEKEKKKKRTKAQIIEEDRKKKGEREKEKEKRNSARTSAATGRIGTQPREFNL